MAKTKPKLSANQAAWKKEAERIKRFIKRAEKRGYKFEENIVPAMPKRVTQAQLTKIKKLTPEMLYRKATYTISGTQMQVSGEEGRKRERQQAYIKAQATREAERRLFSDDYEQSPPQIPKEEVANVVSNVIQSIFDLLDAWQPREQWSNYLQTTKANDIEKVRNILKSAISSEGEDVIAERIEGSAGKINDLIERIMYDSDRDQIDNFDFPELMTILYGRSLTLNESKSFTLAAEYS